MLSDAHHLGLCVAVGACRGTPQLIATEPKECHFSALFRPEICVSRSYAAIAGLSWPLITYYNTTLYSLSTDA